MAAGSEGGHRWARLRGGRPRVPSPEPPGQASFAAETRGEMESWLLAPPPTAPGSPAAEPASGVGRAEANAGRDWAVGRRDRSPSRRWKAWSRPWCPCGRGCQLQSWPPHPHAKGASAPTSVRWAVNSSHCVVAPRCAEHRAAFMKCQQCASGPRQLCSPSRPRAPGSSAVDAIRGLAQRCVVTEAWGAGRWPGAEARGQAVVCVGDPVGKRRPGQQRARALPHLASAWAAAGCGAERPGGLGRGVEGTPCGVGLSPLPARQPASPRSVHLPRSGKETEAREGVHPRSLRQEGAGPPGAAAGALLAARALSRAVPLPLQQPL